MCNDQQRLKLNTSEGDRGDSITSCPWYQRLELSNTNKSTLWQYSLHTAQHPTLSEAELQVLHMNLQLRNQNNVAVII